MPARFVTGLQWSDIPPLVRDRCHALVRDLAAVCAAGRTTPTAVIAAAYAHAQHPGDEATLWVDGSRVTCTGAAFANGVLANALDFDDGHRLVSGHPGAMVLPAALATAELVGASPEETMTAIVIGYEIAIRAGLELHARTDHLEYHGSGAWGALGAAATAARLLGLDHEQLSDALGSAEYHAPMAMIMRSVAEPAMTKDACAWGAAVGVSSALLAGRGFTATRSELATGAAGLSDLGHRWHLTDVYVKRFPCCRWSQPAIQAALTIHATQRLQPQRISRVKVRTFPAATRLAKGSPVTTEQAQYSLVWPVAVALVHGAFGVEHVVGAGLQDVAAARPLGRIEMVVDPRFASAYPARRLTEVVVELEDGSELSSGVTEAPGEPEDPGWLDVIEEKAARYAPSPGPFRWLLTHEDS